MESIARSEDPLFPACRWCVQHLAFKLFSSSIICATSGHDDLSMLPASRIFRFVLFVCSSEEIKGLVGVKADSFLTGLDDFRAVNNSAMRCFQTLDNRCHFIAALFLCFPLVKLDLEFIPPRLNRGNVMHRWWVVQGSYIFSISYSVLFRDRRRLKNLKWFQNFCLVQDTLTRFSAQSWFWSSVCWFCFVKLRWRPLVAWWLRTSTVQLGSGRLLLRFLTFRWYRSRGAFASLTCSSLTGYCFFNLCHDVNCSKLECLVVYGGKCNVITVKAVFKLEIAFRDLLVFPVVVFLWKQSWSGCDLSDWIPNK